MKRLLALVLSVAMPSPLAASCIPTGQTDNGQTSPTTDAGDEGSYAIATNNFGVDAYPLGMMVANEQSATDTISVTLTVTNNEFTTGKAITQLQDQLAASPDGMAFPGISGALPPVATQRRKDAKTLYALYACPPIGEDMEEIEQDECCVGIVIYSPENEGSRLAELALADGRKITMIFAGASGDYTYGRHIVGLTETFETGGGEILFISHSVGPSEAIQKTSNYMIAYGDTDCIYTTSEDYIASTADVTKSRGITDCKIYGSNVNPSVYQLVMDDQVEACMGGEFVCDSLAVALLVNHLDDNPIKDADGTAPYFDNLAQFMVTAENAEGFYEFLNGENLATHTVSDEEYQNLLIRSNPSMNYDYFYDFLANYEENAYAKVEVNAIQ